MRSSIAPAGTFVLAFILLCGISVLAETPPAAAGPTAAVRIPEPLPPIPAGSAVLIVDTPAGAGADTEAMLQRRINTHIATLRSEQHLRKVLSNANSETRKTNWFTAANDPLERAAWLRDHLKAHAIPGTPLIEVSLNDVGDPKDRKTILREICSVYLDSQRVERGDDLLDRTQMLNTLKIKTTMRLKDLSAEMKEKQIRLNIDGGSVGRIGVKDMELSKLLAEQVEAQLFASKAFSVYEATAEALREGRSVPGLREAVIKSSPFLSQDAQQLHQTEQERDLALSQQGADDAKYKTLAKRADLMRAAYEKALDEARKRASAELLEERQQEAAAARLKLESLSKRVDLLKQDLGDLSNSMVGYYNLQEEQKGLREQLKDVTQQIEKIMASRSSADLAGIRWHLQPEEATAP
jgi:uncharacterized protein involved in exopolysaccharide biosynthesis